LYTYINKITPTGFVECVSVFCWDSHIMNEKLPLYIYICLMVTSSLSGMSKSRLRSENVGHNSISYTHAQIRKANKQIQHIIWKGTGPISLYLSLTLGLSLCTSLWHWTYFSTSLWHWTYLSVPLSDTGPISLYLSRTLAISFRHCIYLSVPISPTLNLSLWTYLSDMLAKTPRNII
jgi:hypothetical protein